MLISRSLADIAVQVERSVATIGVFDGAHLAHQELLARVTRRAREHGAASVAITFDPHPMCVVAPARAPKLLTPLPLKLELLARSGVDHLLILPFTEEFSRWAPQQFVQRVLVDTLKAARVLVGENFRFGHRQAGNPQLLQQLGARLDFQTEILPSLRLRGLIVSSSQIRSLLDEGSISRANRLLGRPFSIRGEVAPGLGIGRTQTVPTLNLAPYADLIPARGVYITWARLAPRPEPADSAPHFSDLLPSVTNVGIRPTFGEHGLTIETHLLTPPPEAFTSSLSRPAALPSSPQPPLLEISFLYRLRDERRFDSPAELKAQILRDVRRAQSYFRRLRAFSSTPR